MKRCDVAVIGGGPAGLAAAISARQAGAKEVLVLERSSEPGGILMQCIHNGFGLHTFGEELTGPEYADRFVRKAEASGAQIMTGTMVLDAGDNRVITAMNEKDGLFQLQAGAVVLAMGCRERPRGALNIPGTRPSGIYTAGTAQRMINIEGLMPGKKAVILGSGDIGLIMARRMTLEGASVQAVVELMPYSTGLRRNIVQCLDDFGIPLLLSHTVIRTEGRERLEAVTVAEVDAQRKPIPGTEIRYACDCLLLSCGLIPENELTRRVGAAVSPVTGGPVVDDTFETSVPGIFSCGNVLHVHDLVDYVSEEAGIAGRHAAIYAGRHPVEDVHIQQKESSLSDREAADRKLRGSSRITLSGENGVRYTVPATICPETMDEKVTIRFRVGAVYRDVWLSLYLDRERIVHQKKRILTPGEMCQVTVTREQLSKAKGQHQLTVRIEFTI